LDTRISVEPVENGPATLATAVAERAQQSFAVVMGLIVLAITVGLLFGAGTIMPTLPGFIPVYQTALTSAYAVTAFLLFGQFRRSRALPLLILGAGFAYTAAIVLIQMLTFPNLFAAGRVLGDSADTTTWLWTFWHLGPPVYGLAYAAAIWRRRHPTVAPARVPGAGFFALAIALAAAAGATLLSTRFVALLPKNVVGDDYSLVTTSGVGPAVELLTLAAFALLWRKTRRDRTVIELWLLVSLAVLAMDNLLTMAGGARASVGWYAGRIEALVAGCVILGVFLREIDVLQVRADAAARQSGAAQAALEHAQTRLAFAFNAAGMATWELDMATGKIARSGGHDAIFGYASPCADWTRERFLGQVVEDDRAGLRAAISGEQDEFSVDCRFTHVDGSTRWLNLDGRVLRDAAGEPVLLAGVVMDSTERHVAEQALRQAQKTDAIKQLTGGVAHDFNNLLTVITGALDLISIYGADDARLTRLAESALRSAARGQKLTQQLLAFSRQQVTRPETLNPNKLVLDFEPMLQRAVGAAIAIEMRLDVRLHPVRLDSAQFEAALINLVMNARDALPGAGKIVVESRNVDVDPDAAKRLGTAPGAYVVLTVRDNGIGMNAGTVSRVFDPFFTTKDVGKGSGLGLSQVYGFVQASGGVASIDSKPDAGTAVHLYLPMALDLPLIDDRHPHMPLRRTEDHETVLVVEDDPDVLELAVESLKAFGYHVVAADNAAAALQILRDGTAIDILFSDVIMPGGMNGAQLAVEARRILPALKILLTSGYTASALGKDHGLPPDLEVLSKPYRREDLVRKLRVVAAG
jgi:signal transduction histidine kinase